MENSEVLNQETPKEGALQKDVAPIQDADMVINSKTYTEAKAPGVVGEKNHADQIANDVLNHEEAEKTYSYNSAGEKVYDKSIHTSTTQSTGAVLEGTFKDKYSMGEGYKATDDSDFSWNKMANERAQTIYDQEAAQARYQSIEAKQQLDAQASKAWNNYFAAEYSSKQTQDKMGWTGGQEQSHDLQVEFLKAETAANMYTKSEMQKYGVETKLSVARMYADAEQKSLALKYYQDAQDVAIREGELTGYYVPPEASEMFEQQRIADKILNDPNSTDAEKNRANSVNAACNKYYENLGFERGYRYDKETGKVVTELYGIKVLSQLNYEETVRNNKVNEALQQQANDIAKEANNIGWGNLKLAETQFNEMKVIQNQIETDNILNNKVGPSKSSSNYWIDEKGKEHSIPVGTNLYKKGNNWYAVDPRSKGNEVVIVYNSDKDHTNPVGADGKRTTKFYNYRARTNS